MLRAGRGGGGWRVGSYYWVKFRYGNTKEYYSTTSGLEEFRHQISKELKDIEGGGTWKSERVLITEQGRRVGVEGRAGRVLNFCSNNYLGLSSHPEVVRAGQEALGKYGAGLSSVRFICGTQDIHKELERKIADFHGRDDCILYPSCFDANAGIFEQILGPEDAVISDELNHASIIDGIRLCKAQKFRYAHRNMESLEEKLIEAGNCRRKLVVSDGVFSMDGNVAPLDGILRLAEKYSALTFIDECHATGFFGRTGRGTEEFHENKTAGRRTRVDFINSTLGKALGGAAGGYTTGPQELIDLLRQRSRPYLFSNSLPPPVVGSASKVFDLLMSNSSATDLCSKVRENTTKFRNGMTSAGFTILGENHPICPVFLGDAKLASNFANLMMDEGIYVIGFSYPVVPKGKARIRVQISGAHESEDIQKAIDSFVKIGTQLGVVS